MMDDDWNEQQTEALERVADRDTARLTAALTASSWCAVAENERELVWSYVLADTGRIVRKLRGRKMRTWPDLMDEFGAALQFGDYFGENGAALDECLSDLDWLPTEAGYLLVVVDPEQVLVEGAEEPWRDKQLARLVDILRTAVETFAEPIELGEIWDRPAVPFDVVLVPKPEHAERTRALWRAAGAPIGD